MKNIGVIFAGGAGSRIHSKERPKQFLEIYNKPIIIHTLEHFERCDEIDAVTVACLKDWIGYFEELLYRYRINKVKKIVPGGDTGQASIYEALKAAKEVAGGEEAIVLIHDGVRPLISPELLSKNIACVKEHGSAITGVVLKETLVVVDENDSVVQVPSRKNSRVARAPQSFYLSEILKAHEEALQRGETNIIDSCTMMRSAGKELYLLEGPSENIKITTPDDFYSMRAILEAKENAQIYGYE